MSPRKSVCLLLFSCLVVGLLGGCSLVAKTDISQGTVMSEEMVQQVKVGTSKSEVLRIFGANVLSDPFYPQQWNFVYLKKLDNGQLVKQVVRLTFDQSDKVSKIDTQGEFVKEDRSAAREPGYNQIP
jgi:outer membrane protein assembly factor BamE